MTNASDNPSPSPAARETMIQAYDKAAATTPGACGGHVIDASGKCVPCEAHDRPDTKAVAPAP